MSMERSLQFRVLEEKMEESLEELAKERFS